MTTWPHSSLRYRYQYSFSHSLALSLSISLSFFSPSFSGVLCVGPNMRFTEFSHVGKPLFPACFKIHLQTVWDRAAMIRTLNVFLVARYVFLALESMFYYFFVAFNSWRAIIVGIFIHCGADDTIVRKHKAGLFEIYNTCTRDVCLKYDYTII